MLVLLQRVTGICIDIYRCMLSLLQFSRFEKSLAIGEDLNVGGATTVGGALTVTGNAYFNGNVDVGGDLTFDEVNAQ